MSRIVLRQLQASCTAVVLIVIIRLSTWDVGIAEAAVFGNDIALDDAILNRAKSLSPIQTDSTGRQYLQIDDMLLPVRADNKVAFRGFQWDEGPTRGISDVPVDFDADVSTAERRAFFDACNQWSMAAPIRCVARTTQTSFVHVLNGNGNYSFVGRIGGRQDLSIGLLSFARTLYYAELWGGHSARRRRMR